MTITEFLLARIEEDEAIARDRPNSAQIHYSGCYYYNYSLDANWECDCDDDGEGTKRLLAECAAKRAIIALHRPITQYWWPEQVPVEVCEMCDDERWECETIRALASVYSGHKDYNWRGWGL